LHVAPPASPYPPSFKTDFTTASLRFWESGKESDGGQWYLGTRRLPRHRSSVQPRPLSAASRELWRHAEVVQAFA
jgi:hypothetical protein